MINVVASCCEIVLACLNVAEGQCTGYVETVLNVCVLRVHSQ